MGVPSSFVVTGGFSSGDPPDAVSGEYWSSPGGVVASIVSLVKSKVTGEPYEGRNDTVEL